MYMDATLSFDEQITSVTSSCLSSLSQINRIKHLLDRNTLLNVINALVFSKLYYYFRYFIEYCNYFENPEFGK